MGYLKDGHWQTAPLLKKKGDGSFERADSTFRNDDIERVAGRYHLVVSYACPWAHRTLIARALFKLDDVISVGVVSPLMGDQGWVFDAGLPSKADKNDKNDDKALDSAGRLEGLAAADARDPVTGVTKLHELYTKADPTFSGKVTVPVLWDKQRHTIVNNESSEILRLLDRVFNDGNLYPQALRAEIDEVNDRIYPTLNNGVYRCGFAQTQQAYDDAVGPLFETMGWLEARLQHRAFLVGDTLTEADIRLFTTLVRFDAVYVTHFKCNQKRLVEHPALLAHTRRIFQLPGVKETVRFDHIKQHYFKSHPQLNPSGIVPAGFDVQFD